MVTDEHQKVVDGFKSDFRWTPVDFKSRYTEEGIRLAPAGIDNIGAHIDIDAAQKPLPSHLQSQSGR